MRAALLAFAIVLCASSAHAGLPRFPTVVTASPSADPLPLSGSIFIEPIEHAPHIRWIEGYGDTKLSRVGGYTRIDYTANDRSVADIDGIVYKFAIGGSGTRARSVSLHRDGGSCGTISITLDAPAAAVRAQLTAGETLQDYWLVSRDNTFELVPHCERHGSTWSTLHVFAIHADGTREELGVPVPVGNIPVWPGDEASGSAAARLVVDWRIIQALSIFFLAALVGAFVRPRVALHGLTVANYLPNLRFRVRLPRARIYRR